jgi:catechol 2,3-dioxygenase
VPASADRIAPATSLGPVHLTVADLGRSIEYYGSAIGLGVLERSNGRASLGTGETELLVLVEEAGARPARGHTGLFHVALLLPDRMSLARWLAHASRDRVQLTGLSDHYVSEAIYLRDPDEHGLEIYADRARELWEGEVRRMGTWPLDVDDLLSVLGNPAAERFDGLPDGTVVGHVHLCVARIPDVVEFYRDVLGFDLMALLGDQAAFLSAGGYHHHIGANTWESRDATPPPPGSAALRHATILLPSPEERDLVVARVAASGQEPEQHPDGPLVRDPSGNALVLHAPGLRPGA